MGIIKDNLKKQVDNNNKVQFSESTGTILKYDRTTDTCTIKYPNPHGEGFLYKNNVRIQNSSGGLASSSYQVGQECSISFINGNVFSPVITGINQSYYAERACTDQGAYIANDEVYKVSTPEHIIAMNLDWIDEDNTNTEKYQNDLGQYQDTNVDQQAMDMITTIDKYQDNEVGITNLTNNSTVKLRENGDIDIFTSNNTGIRICKNGNIKLYCKDVEYTNTLGEETDKSLSTQLTVAQIMKICLAYDIIKETDDSLSIIEETSAASN